MVITFRQFEKLYQKIAKIRVIKTLITITLTLEIMQHLNFKPWRRSHGARKKFLNKKLKNCKCLKKIA